MMDLYATFAEIAGGEVPTDRVIDSVDQTAFLTGQSEKSARDGLMVYLSKRIFGVKWHNWKMMFN
ncbi:hypothetical protein [Ruegeria profundi]|uniref:hypothetical protein n=1 Tax=Ruegeria profundi TaxID=1685378 RepID=UPI003C7C8352